MLVARHDDDDDDDDDEMEQMFIGSCSIALTAFA